MNYLLQIAKENAVIIIAGLALLLTVWQGWQTRKHNRLSVKPLLKIIADERIKPSFSNLSPIQQLDLKIINKGLGPAIIKNFILQFDGKELTRNNQKFHMDKVREKLRGKVGKDAKLSFLVSDSVMQAGDNTLLLGIEYDLAKDSTDGIDKLDILVEYYSIYKDKTFACSTKDIRNPDNSKSQ